MPGALCFRVFVFWAGRKGLCFVFLCFEPAQRTCVLCFRVLADPPQNTGGRQTYMIQHSEPAEPVQDRMGYGAMGMGRRTPDLNCLSDLQKHLKGFKTKLEPVKGVLSPLLLSH
jgi:hypothetical protein